MIKERTDLDQIAQGLSKLSLYSIDTSPDNIVLAEGSEIPHVETKSAQMVTLETS